MVYIGGSGRAVSSTRKLRYLILCVAVLGGGTVLLSLNNVGYLMLYIHYKIPYAEWNLQHIHDIENKFTIQTTGCSISAMKPFDESIKKYVSYPKNISPCKYHNMPLLVDSNSSSIWINPGYYKYYNISKKRGLSCCYKSFYRPTMIEDITSTKVDDRVKYRECISFTATVHVKDEFVRVTCTYNSKNIFDQYYLFALTKKFISHDDKKEFPKNKPGYNVLILGIDSVSRMNFHRTMPKTLGFLQKKGAIELLGYNKVGDNTFPNLIPMLLGIRNTELKKTCVPTSKSTFDNCPFIWEWFKQAGYFTALAEDNSYLGTFNYLAGGFSGTPTDYYIHTFMHEADINVGNNHDFNSNLCMRDKYFYKILLDYVQELTLKLRNNKLFGFFWEVTMSHDYLNYPMIMDKHYEEFFRSLNNSEYLKETILFLVSDHGIRWGDIRSTKQGRLEERLPFVFVLIPASFHENYNNAYNNLKLNSKRLTTPFDIHETLLDLVNLENINDANITLRSRESYASHRGVSLFLPVPRNRTCRLADIDDHWCTCHKEIKLPITSTESINAANQLVLHLNNLLSPFPQCASLKLQEIIEVTEIKVGSWVGANEGGMREFMVVVRTSPGEGVFEGTLRNSIQEWTMAGTVSRLNLYGDQSRCIQLYQMKLYCYCS